MESNIKMIPDFIFLQRLWCSRDQGHLKFDCQFWITVFEETKALDFLTNNEHLETLQNPYGSLHF